ncbi:hypothetical protein GCM10023320_23840 [Pseudonocardia adelaidensis]|uniref:Uncharacterized protein n=1 Tax=Pseudonocardia adelaidensis TaxID=648754 RepID=A0ABP9NGF4_9PSEU
MPKMAECIQTVTVAEMNLDEKPIRAFAQRVYVDCRDRKARCLTMTPAHQQALPRGLERVQVEQAQLLAWINQPAVSPAWKQLTAD